MKSRKGREQVDGISHKGSRENVYPVASIGHGACRFTEGIPSFPQEVLQMGPCGSKTWTGAYDTGIGLELEIPDEPVTAGYDRIRGNHE